MFHTDELTGYKTCSYIDQSNYELSRYLNTRAGNYYSGKIRNYFGLYTYEQFLKHTDELTGYKTCSYIDQSNYELSRYLNTRAGVYVQDMKPDCSCKYLQKKQSDEKDNQVYES